MAPTQLICRIQVTKAKDYEANTTEKEENSAVYNLKDCPEVGFETRAQWANKIMSYFAATHDSIQPWDFLVNLDGSVQLLPLPTQGGDVCYPARFQIPPATISDLDENERVRRADRFAMASLLYEIDTGAKPFEGLTDDEVQQRFSSADIPDDAKGLPHSLLIFSGWSEEFAEEFYKLAKSGGFLQLIKDGKILQAINNHARAHPILTGIQVAGLGVCAISALAIPILGAAGFTAIGPAAGSAAAAWQSSIGVVQAGSVFAWCQSAAMGGATLGAIQGVGVGGVIAAGAAGATGAAINGANGKALPKVADVPRLVETFKRVCRKADN